MQIKININIFYVCPAFTAVSTAVFCFFLCLFPKKFFELEERGVNISPELNGFDSKTAVPSLQLTNITAYWDQVRKQSNLVIAMSSLRGNQ